MSKIVLHSLFISSLLIIATANIPGHNEWLGHQRPAEGHIDILNYMPTPQEFWNDYCSVGKPVLIKNAAGNMPAITKWTDSYLHDNYGDLMVKLESKLEKEFKPEGNLGMGQDSIAQFISTYIEENKYIVSQLPGPLASEVAVPQCLLCGSFRERILEANLWISSGNTQSLLHRDADNAINCLLNGTKDWILIDPKYEDLLPIAVEAGTPYGGFTLLDINKVDLIRFPKVKDVAWFYANVSAGDCLFLPKSHWHQVRSYGNKNMAVSFLIARLAEFEPYGCPETGLPNSELLSDVPMVWTYDGYSQQTMGNTDPFELNETISELCELGNNQLTYEIWEEYVISNLEVDEEHLKGTVEFDLEKDFVFGEDDILVMQERARLIMDIIDQEKIGVVSCNNLSHLDVPLLKEIATILDPDPANTAESEFIQIEHSMIKRLLFSSTGLHKDVFLKSYLEAAGSKAGAEWILQTLDSNQDYFISMGEILKNIDSVKERFKQSTFKDISKNYMHDDKSSEAEKTNRDEL